MRSPRLDPRTPLGWWFHQAKRGTRKHEIRKREKRNQLLLVTFFILIGAFFFVISPFVVSCSSSFRVPLHSMLIGIGLTSWPPFLLLAAKAPSPERRSCRCTDERCLLR